MAASRGRPSRGPDCCGDGGPGPHRLIAVEIGRGGANWGTPRGRAAISYDAQRRTLTVTVQASGLTPGPHAAHIHLGSCQSQGPVKYMLADLVANRHGRIAHAVRVFTHVTTPIPAHGWYLNIHQGNSGDILRNGQPTILFRPLLCANIRGSGSISSILRAGDVVTGVRGTGNGRRRGADGFGRDRKWGAGGAVPVPGLAGEGPGSGGVGAEAALPRGDVGDVLRS